MKIYMNLVTILLLLMVYSVSSKTRKPTVLNKHWVCSIKRSCIECLTLPHCSWCHLENKCFSKTIQPFPDYCNNNTINSQDYGFGLEENALCACTGSTLERNCNPPDAEGADCSGRGKCVCGKCVCDVPDAEHPNKVVMGEYCEYDNFSCVEPCNEGPYRPFQISTRSEDDVIDVNLPSDS